MSDYKPGYKTTEFWLALGTFITYGLFLLGSFTVDTRDAVKDTVSHSIESVAMIIAQSVTLIKYTHARKEVKCNPKRRTRARK